MDARALPIFMSQPTEIMRLNHPLERSDSLQRLARSLMPDQERNRLTPEQTNGSEKTWRC